MQLSEPYRKREVQFLDLWKIEEWTLKAYSIVYGDQSLDHRLLDAGRLIAQKRLSESANQTNHYGVGFVGVHQGKTGNFLFVDWWADENELHHHVYVSPSDEPESFVYMTPTGLTACAWDLFVIGHERNAWVDNVLANPEGADIPAYLSSTFTGRV